MKETKTAFLGLGSNMGDRRRHLDEAVRDLKATPGVRVAAVSRYVESEPVGMDYAGLFINAAVKIETTLDPLALLDVVQDIELRHGRGLRPGRRGLPRPLDIDILLFGGETIDSERLKIPHPQISVRPFVTGPLRELGAL